MIMVVVASKLRYSTHNSVTVHVISNALSLNCLIYYKSDTLDRLCMSTAVLCAWRCGGSVKLLMCLVLQLL